jgi:tRNA1Val (adenine37-N6)-methyltransferase
MSNSPKVKNHTFQFKQFSVSDKNCGMKIGTDGVLLGAIAAGVRCTNVLDIGTGCGLIGLMIAQKQNATIDCIDIDPLSYSDAKTNIENSPWSSRLRLFKTSFQEFTKFSTKKYNLIVCNPPFFHNSLKTSSLKRNTARHSDSLSYKELFDGVAKILDDSGAFLIIFPSSQKSDVNIIIENLELFVNEEYLIRPNPEKDVHRVILSISKKKQPVVKYEFAIETGIRHQYSEEYKILTQDYYL